MPRPARKLSAAERQAFARLRRAAAMLPDVEAATSFGNPALKTAGKVLAVIDRYQGAACVWLRIHDSERAWLLGKRGWFASPHDPRRESLCCALDAFDWRRVRTLLRSSHELVQRHPQAK